MPCYNLLAEGTKERVRLCTEAPNVATFGIVSAKDAASLDIDFVWILICAFLVMLMQLGFTLLEAGAVRYKNNLNIMFKNFVDFCLGAMVWYFFGWALTAPPVDSDWDSEFMGSGDITLKDSKDYLNWFFSMVFAATAATIVSGAVAERTTLQAYMAYSFAITAWVYPIVVYWVWSGSGVFSAGKDYEMIDFAGSGVVHMVGGFSGLMGAMIIGPRKGTIVPHSVAFQVMGVFLLFFGWFGFNCGSTLSAQGNMTVASRVAVTTTLSACSAGLTAVSIAKLVENAFCVERMGNGILAGLVGITAGCHVVEPWGAIMVGILSGMIYFGTSKLMVCVGIDDPLDAFAVHGASGFWGVLACAFFGTKDFIVEGGYTEASDSFGKRFRNQLCGALAIASWTVLNSGTLFGILRLTGNLRIDDETEKSGMNIKHSSRVGKAMDPWQFRNSDHEKSDVELEIPDVIKKEATGSLFAPEIGGGEAVDEEVMAKEN